MSNEASPRSATSAGARRHARNTSFNILHAALAHELDFLSDDDIEYAPEAVIVSLLEGVTPPTAEGASKALRNLVPATFSISNLPDTLNPPKLQTKVTRDALLAECLAVLKKSQALVLAGAAGVGKSYFLNELFCPSARVRSIYPRIARIDCSSLRMQSAALFEREAIWAMFGKRDDAFRRFLREITFPTGEDGLAEPYQLGTSRALIYLLKRKFIAGGLVVFDHLEYVHRSGEIDSLFREFCSKARDVGLHIIFCDRRPITSKPLRFASGLPTVEVQPLSNTELDCWLDQPALASHGRGGLTGSAIQACTGGNPGLLRDLAKFLTYEPLTNQDPPKLYGLLALEAFERIRALSYITECERYFRAARYHVPMLSDGLKALNGGDVPAYVVEKVVASGAVRRVSDLQASGTTNIYVYSSSIHARRIGSLQRAESLALLAHVVDDRTVADNGFRNLKKVPEFAASAMARYLATQRKPQQALARFVQLLAHWGFEAIVHVRDPYNARLWCAYDKPHDLRPLSSFDEPDFAQAAQTGQIAVNEDGSLYIPMTGNSGVVEMIVEGRFKQRTSESTLYRREIDIDCLAGLIRSLRPTLAQALERLALYRDRQLSERILHKMGFDDPSKGWLLGIGTLRDTSCTALAVLERSASEWFATKIETADGLKSSADWTESCDTQKLDAIAAHPSRRGLVLTGTSAWNTFPSLQDSQVSLYIRPVWVHHRRVCRLVAFVFEGSTVKSLDGQLQRQLAAVAHDLILAAS